MRKILYEMTTIEQRKFVGCISQLSGKGKVPFFVLERESFGHFCFGSLVFPLCVVSFRFFVCVCKQHAAYQVQYVQLRTYVRWGGARTVFGRVCRTVWDTSPFHLIPKERRFVEEINSYKSTLY